MNNIKEYISKNKVKVILVSLLIIIVTMSVVYFTNKTYSEEVSSFLDNQSVEGLSFENAKLIYEDNTSIITVEVYNTEDKTVNFNYIELVFIDEDGNEETLIGYIGRELNGHEGRELTARIDKDLSNTKELKYNIVRRK